MEASFKKDFPNAQKVTWEEEHGKFEAGFTLGTVHESATYDKSGHRNEVEVAIKVAELPAAVQEYLKTHFADSKVIEAAKITNDKNVITFEAEVSGKGKKQDVLFDVNGKFIKTQNTD